MSSTIIDSKIFTDMFSDAAMRQVWSDENRTAKYLDIERALAKVQGELRLIAPKETLLAREFNARAGVGVEPECTVASPCQAWRTNKQSACAIGRRADRVQTACGSAWQRQYRQGRALTTGVGVSA